MELYDSKYVYFEWDKELDGKKGFVAKNIQSLKDQVNRHLDTMVTITDSGEDVNPFTYFIDDGFTSDYAFAYYDPYYEFRKAYLEGKQLQFKDYVGNWKDVVGELIFTRDEYRIKPETTWYIVLNDHGLSRCNSKEDRYVIYEGTEDECIKWIDEHKKFEKIMIAWINGAQIEIEILDPILGIRWISATKPTWDISNNYRIKPKAVESVPFDSVQELIDAWDNKYPQNKNRPEGTMPFIWIKCKEKNRVYLITDFLFEKAYNCDVGTEDENLKLTELFNDFTFADGSIIGKVKEDE